MPISALPTPPSRSDSPQDFSDRADALLGALPGFVTEANALQSDVNAKEASASSHATIATNKAAEAQASATTASTKASEAAASAIAAAAAANNAEIAFDSFDDKYLGSKASDPTTDNDGNPLLTGALYWNTTVGAVRVWNGSTWLSMAADASIVDFQQSGAGAVVRTAQDKMRELVSVKDFGAVGDGVTDDTAAIQAACTAAKTIIFGSSADNYRVTGTITLTSGITLLMQGATVTQATDQTPIFNATGTDNVTITGGRFFGKSEASYTNSPSSQAICIKASNATDLVVVGNRFENFWYSPLMVDVGGNRIEFSSNNVKGPGAAVLGVDINRRNTTGCTLIGANLRIVNNDIYDTAQGIIVGQGSENVTIDGNVIHDLINEHGIYADTGIRRLTISNNVIRSTGTSGVGLKVQCYDEYGVQPQNIAITGNVIDNTGSAGILVINASTAPTLMAVGVTISGNTVLNAGANAIDVRSADDCLVVGNTVVAPLQSGIYWDRCGNLTLADNYIRGSGTSGMRDGGSSSNGVVIKYNTIRNCATGNSVGDEFGIFLNSGATNCVIDGNVMSDANANMQYGVYVIPNINSTLSIVNNTVIQSTDGALRLNSTAALREYRGNSWNGTIAATYNDPVLPVVASAATLTLPTAHDVVEISGTTTITAITANGHSGRRVTLLFQDALTVVRSSQIVLNQSAGNFVTTGNDTLTLISNGVVWLEVARSAN